MQAQRLHWLSGFTLLTVEICNIIAIIVISICLARIFTIAHVGGTPVGRFALTQALSAGSGMIVGVLVAFRMIFWRWTGSYEKRLRRLGSMFMAISTTWSVIIIGLSTLQNKDDDFTVRFTSCEESGMLMIVSRVAASVLMCACLVGHILLVTLHRSVCEVLREFAPSFGMIYE